MPRGAQARQKAAAKAGSNSTGTATLDPTDSTELSEESTVSTAVDTEAAVEATEEQDTAFEFSMEAAPADYEPDRKTPGRTRTPSFFDDKLRAEGVFESGTWQRVPATSAEHKAAILRELNRAKIYLNKQAEGTDVPQIGLDLDDKKDDAVYFKSRTAQTRERKASAEGGESDVEGTEAGVSESVAVEDGE